MKVCISVKDETIQKLDYALSVGLFPDFVNSRSSAIAYLISEFNEQTLEKYLDDYNACFKS